MKDLEDKQSKVFELVKFIKNNEKTDSYDRFDNLMQDALLLAINAQFKFDKSDFENIYKSVFGEYWFGENTNGKGCGEIFYNLACKVGNISACQSYEAFFDFKPFITKRGNRLHERSQLRRDKRHYRVTGFDFETKKIHFVSYELSDWEQNGKKQLHCFDNKEWNEARKDFIEL